MIKCHLHNYHYHDYQYFHHDHCNGQLGHDGVVASLLVKVMTMIINMIIAMIIDVVIMMLLPGLSGCCGVVSGTRGSLSIGQVGLGHHCDHHHHPSIGQVGPDHHHHHHWPR